MQNFLLSVILFLLIVTYIDIRDTIIEYALLEDVNVSLEDTKVEISFSTKLMDLDELILERMVVSTQSKSQGTIDSIWVQVQKMEILYLQNKYILIDDYLPITYTKVKYRIKFQSEQRDKFWYSKQIKAKRSS